MTRRYRLGAVPHPDGSTVFTLWAPAARRVQLVLGGGGDGDERVVELEARADGYHHAAVPGVGAGDRYAYLLDDDPARLPDPASASQPDGVHGPSQVVDHEAFEWSDEAWYGLPLRDYVIYELHVGTFTPEGTFEAIIPRLQELADLGVTAIELLPVAQFPGGRNWGYDGVDLFAPQSTYGGPGGLRRLVDEAHRHGIAVVLDVVYNHLGPEGNYLGRFGPYFSDRHQTLWGQAVNVDGPGSDEVRRFFTENALQWLRDYHVDALRLDAVHAIIDTSATPFLAELADAVEEEADELNRRAFLIAESDLNDVRVITPRESGGWGHDAQWTDDFHHALRTTVTGERSGYYADYDGIRDLARSYREGFVYSGQHSPGRGRRHGSRTAGLPGQRFVVYAQNHDQVGNRLLGDRLSTTVSPELLKVASAAVLLSPFVPMLFMGEEYGEQAPFPYFVSHGDPDLVAAVREGRRREFASFGFQGEAPDPQGEETFRSAVLQWGDRCDGVHGQLLAWNRELLRARRGHASIRRMRPHEVDVRIDASAGWLVLHRSWAGDETATILNFGTAPVALGEALRPDGAHGWQRVLDSADDRFGGAGIDRDAVRGPGAALLRRAPDESRS